MWANQMWHIIVALKTINYSNKLPLEWMNHKPIGGQVFKMNGWEACPHATIPPHQENKLQVYLLHKYILQLIPRWLQYLHIWSIFTVMLEIGDFAGKWQQQNWPS